MTDQLDLTELSMKQPIERATIVGLGVYQAQIETFDDPKLFTYRIGIARDYPEKKINFDQGKFIEELDGFLKKKAGRKRASSWWRGDRTWYWFINDTKLKNEFIAFVPRAQVLAKLLTG